MTEVRRAPCRGAWYTTDESATAHGPHGFFPLEWGEAASCPGWTDEEAGAVALVDQMIRADPSLPGLAAQCHPAVQHALVQVVIPDFADFADGERWPQPIQMLFGVPIEFTTAVERGTWKLTSDEGPIADGTTVEAAGQREG
jgi:hypothetical protein